MPETLHGPRYRLSFADAREIDEFVEMLGKFERGEISSDTWRKYRLVRGTYGQRQDDVQMLRVKIPQGVLSAPQLLALADVAERHSRGFVHVTTRQNVQFHFVQLADIEAAMRVLADAGLTTREACGNAVRNITACPYAGVAPDEIFDVTPYAEALTRYLLRHPLSAVLPRKFKIAFEGCPEDHALTAINDLGWRARVDTIGTRMARGFRLVVGGGTSILPTSARTLFDFVPAAEIFDVAEAILRVYHRLGDYEHRQRNRMKFLIKALGWDRWRDEVYGALDGVKREGGARLPFDPDAPPEEVAPDPDRPDPPGRDAVESLVASSAVRGPGVTPGATPMPSDTRAFDAWRATNLRPQRQSGFHIAIVRLVLGDITGGQLRALAALAPAYGDGTIRLTPDQNVFLRWVPASRTVELHDALAGAGLARAGASSIADVTSCPGADSCRLAVTHARGLGADLVEALASRPEVARAVEQASIKISGCPNGCGQHHVATIGFQGSLRKVDGRAVPQYFVMLGGRSSSEGATFARLTAKIPARRLRTALERLLDLYRVEKQTGEGVEEFFGRVTIARVKSLLADLELFTAAAARPEDYVDLGDTAAFMPDVMDGECAT